MIFRPFSLATLLFIQTNGFAWAPSKPPPLTQWQVNNAEYLIAIDGNKYKLKDGKVVTGSLSKGNYISIKVYKTAFGDMNGDGAPDAVVLLAVNGGGSGTFHELAILLNRGGKPVYAATKRGLGDRNIVNSLAIVKSVAIIEMLVQGPADAMALPTKKVKWKFRLKWDKRLKYRVVQVR